jgi:hypothetical protein
VQVRYRNRSRLCLAVLSVALIGTALAVPEGGIPASALIQPEDLVKALQSAKGDKPLVIQVGSHVLYTQAHIPGSEYIGPATSEAGLEQLRKRVKLIPRRSTGTDSAAGGFRKPQSYCQ